MRRADKISWEKRRVRRLARGVCLRCGGRAVASWKCHVCGWRHIVCRQHNHVHAKMALSGHMNKHSPKSRAYRDARRAKRAHQAEPGPVLRPIFKLIEDATVELAAAGTLSRLLGLVSQQTPSGTRYAALRRLVCAALGEAERLTQDAVGRFVDGGGRPRGRTKIRT